MNGDRNTEFLDKPTKDGVSAFIDKRVEYLAYLKENAMSWKNAIDHLLFDVPMHKPNPNQTYLPANTAFKVSESKKRAVTAGTPDLEYVALDESGEKAAVPLKHLFEYKWMTTESDRIYSLAARDAFRYGNGWLYEGYKQVKGLDRKLVKDKDGNLTVQEEDRIYFDDIYCEHLEYDTVYRDGRSISDCNELAIIRTHTRDKFLRLYDGRAGFNVPKDIPRGKKYYYDTEDSSGKLTFHTNLNTDDSYVDLVTVVEYFNKAHQCWIVLANGVWINPLKENRGVTYYPFPTADGKLPVKEVVNIYIPSRVYDQGEIELCYLDIKGIDSCRNLSLDSAKANLGVTTVDATEGELDIDTFEFGGTIMRVDNANNVKHFSPNINTAGVDRAQQEFVRNIIEKTQIDFRILDLNGTEQEVELTNEERYSTNKAVKDFILTNSNSFWLDWANSRIANIITYFDPKKTKVPLKGFSVGKDGSAVPSKGDYGTFDITPNILKGNISIIPKFESVISDSTDKQKKQLLEFNQIFGNAKDPKTNQFIFDPKRLAEKVAPFYGVNVEQITANNELNLSGEELRKQLEGNLLSPTANSSEIPPEQRSPNTQQITPISGSNTEV